MKGSVCTWVIVIDNINTYMCSSIFNCMGTYIWSTITGKAAPVDNSDI